MDILERTRSHLPYLRRFARSLVGSQELGDAIVRGALEELAAGDGRLPQSTSPRVGLYAHFYKIFRITMEGNGLDLTGYSIAGLPRQVFLLTALEGFATAEAAEIMGIDVGEATKLLSAANDEIAAEPPVAVLIIEDEPVIAADIEANVQELGHKVSGVAATRHEAVASAIRNPPDLALVDIQLADGSSGIDAAKDIIERQPIPTIFVTAFPERLLTGDRPEPTYLITKPYQPATLKLAISQALYFHRSGDASGVSPPILNNPEELSEPSYADFEAMPSPVVIDVIDGLLDIAPGGAISGTPADYLNTLRISYLDDAAHLLSRFEGKNQPGLFHRLQRVHDVLALPISEEMGLRLGAQSQGLQIQIDQVVDFLIEDFAGELLALGGNLKQFSLQFSSWRAFVQESMGEPPLQPDLGGEIVQLSKALQSSERVSISLRSALEEVTDARDGLSNGILDSALVRIVSESFRAIGRWWLARMVGAGGEINSLVEKGISAIFTVGVVETLLDLAGILPKEFNFVRVLLKMLSIEF